MRGGGQLAHTLLVLGRVSNLPTVWTNCLAAWFLAGAGWDLWLARVVAGASLLYTGGMFLNDACDAAFDREYRPERPIPSGWISRRAVATLAVVLIGAGAAILALAHPGGAPLVAALAAAVVLYDLVHKRWNGSILIMGACRLLLFVVVGGVAVGATASREVWIAAAGLFAYVVGVSATARGESTGGAVSPWWRCLLFGPPAAWLALGPSWPGAVFAGLFVAWLVFQLRRLHAAGAGAAGPFVGAMLAAIVLADALVVSTADARVAWLCAAFLPLNLLLQRHVPAT